MFFSYRVNKLVEKGLWKLCWKKNFSLPFNIVSYPKTNHISKLTLSQVSNSRLFQTEKSLQMGILKFDRNGGKFLNPFPNDKF